MYSYLLRYCYVLCLNFIGGDELSTCQTIKISLENDLLANHEFLHDTYEISATVNGKPSWTSISYYAIWYFEGKKKKKKKLIGKRDDIGTNSGQIFDYQANYAKDLAGYEKSTDENGRPSWTFSYAIWYCEDKWLIGLRGDIGTKFGKICFKGSLLGPDKTDVLEYKKGDYCRIYRGWRGEWFASTANDITIECNSEKGKKTKNKV